MAEREMVAYISAEQVGMMCLYQIKRKQYNLDAIISVVDCINSSPVIHIWVTRSKPEQKMINDLCGGALFVVGHYIKNITVLRMK